MTTHPSEQLIAALRAPDAYPHPVQSIELRETHISWVLLTGEFAYKIKKPVSLGFLDFSTLELRRHYCVEELRLNRRYSPDLYLDVVPIAGTCEHPQIGGSGPPIEYAVRMRQFPEEALLSRMLRQQTLAPAHVDALAAAISQFHGDAAVAAPDSAFGTPEAVWKPIEESFRHLRRAEDGREAIERLWAWSCDECSRRREAFLCRRRDGFIRECHGDLHAGNLLWLNGAIRMFDCIEFNAEFRWIDVLSDVAFTVMDLADFGRRDLAHRLLDAYLAHTGDYLGLGVWRYYLVYRALVRAKVAVIRGLQAEAGAPQRQQSTVEFQGYLALAEDFARPPHPLLVIAHGPSGSGKTTLTQPLLEALGAVRIRSDLERRRAAPLPSTAGDEDRYSLAARQRVYQHLARLAAAILDSGLTAIVDATFLARAHRALFRELAARLGVPFVILDFRASAETLRRRITVRRARQVDASEADEAVLALQLQEAEPLDEIERASAIAVDTEADDAVPRLLEAVRARISIAPAEP